ncbi:hypothetical protein ACFQ41_01415 [Lacticaseibacillus suilingensis]|uniref:Uncharacterized protein n=1 Tax=Lacticaseibacillus suilingensis TaxID=2799577 RepID=A0ABW4BDM2_9LACO
MPAQTITAGLTAARVIGTSHQQYTIVAQTGQFQAQVAGRLANFTSSIFKSSATMITNS